MSDGAVDSRGALGAVERVLNRGGDSQDVLRSVLEVLHARGVESGRVRYLKDGGLTGGISVGGGPSWIVTPVVSGASRSARSSSRSMISPSPSAWRR